MQCFTGCFALSDAVGPQSEQQKSDCLSVKQASSVSGSAALQPEVHVFSSLIPGSAGSNHALKAKLGVVGICSSTQSVAAVQACSNSSPVSREQLHQEYVLQHGTNIMAMSTLRQDRLKYFLIPGIGYIAYAMMYNGPEFLNKRSAMVLSDPVCDPQHFSTMAEAFLQQHPQAMWCQVSAAFASVLQDMGFTVNSMGGETRLDLATYNFTGYARRGLRSAISAATKEGITVQEVMHPPAGSLGTTASGHAGTAAATGAATDQRMLAEEMRHVGVQWAASKTGRASDFWFINRQPIFAPEPGVRKFIACDSNARLLGYIFFDGVFESGKLVGYYANVTRMLPDAHPGTLNFMIKTFLELVRSEVQLAAPAKKLSVKRSQRKKQAAAAADAPAGADTTAADTGAGAARDQRAVAPAAARPLFLSLGLSPFCQMDNSGVNFDPAVHKAFEKLFEIGDAFYPFKALAAAKAKYGAGLHNSKFEDPAVQYNQAYFCHRRGGKGGLVAAFDLAKLCGLWNHPADAAVQFVSHKIKTRLAKRRSAAKPNSRSGRVSIDASSTTEAAAAVGQGSNGIAAPPMQKQKAVAAAAATAAAVAANGGQGLISAGDSAASLIGTAPSPGSHSVGSELATASYDASTAGCSEITVCTGSESD